MQAKCNLLMYLLFEKIFPKDQLLLHLTVVSPPTADEVPSYSVTTLTIVIVAPIIVLIVLSAIAILVFRRIHNNQMERLTSRDAEYGTIDGLIASNVGESTLAVSRWRPCRRLPPKLIRKNGKEQLEAYLNLLCVVYQMGFQCF